MERVGKAYKVKGAAVRYARREWTGEHVADRGQWRVEYREDPDGWWVYIEEIKQERPSLYCKHGTYIGDPCGPDYICGYCEMGE